MATTKLLRRELVTLAKPVDMDKRPKIAGWLMSEKLDGTRCFWDGGITRGAPTDKVPWASLVHPKTGERKTKIKPVSTGLWSRYGNPINAPDWFLDQLPPVMMDGELFAGRGQFQTCRSIIAGDCPDSRWKQIKYLVYGAPSLETITEPGEIKNANTWIRIEETALQDVLALGFNKTVAWAMPDHTFVAAMKDLARFNDGDSDVWDVHLQQVLSDCEEEAWSQINRRLGSVLAQGGEGVMLRNPSSLYEVKRTSNLLKVKASEDDEGTLVGFTAGKGKYTGMIGALIISYQGQEFELSGMTDDERVIEHHAPSVVEGKRIQGDIKTKHFNIGDVIEFTFRELTDAGIPKEARFQRIKRGVNETA